MTDELPKISDLSRAEMKLFTLVRSETQTFFVSTGREGQLFLDAAHTPKWETFHMPDGTTAKQYGGAD